MHYILLQVEKNTGMTQRHAVDFFRNGQSSIRQPVAESRKTQKVSRLTFWVFYCLMIKVSYNV